MPKLPVNFVNHISQDSNKNEYLGPVVILVLLHHNTLTNVDQICRVSVISFSLETHKKVAVLAARSFDSYSGWFVWNQLPHVGVKA